MNLKGAGCVLACTFLIYLVIDTTECKRGGGRKGGVYRGSSSMWGRNKQSSGSHDAYGRRNKQQHSDQPELYKPSAPPGSVDTKKASSDFLAKERGSVQTPTNTNLNKKASDDFIKKESSVGSAAAAPKTSPGASSSDFVQHEKSQQRPVGWDVPGSGTANKKVEGDIGKSTNWNTASGQSAPSYGHSNPGYGAPGGAYPGPPAGSPYGSPAYGHSNPGYGAPAGAYPGPPAGSPYGSSPYHNAPQYGQHHQQPLGPPPPYSPPGSYHPNPQMSAPVGHYNNYGGHGGYGGYGGYGGNNPYYGNHGGFGGFGGGGGGFGGFGSGYMGQGMGGYGKKYGGGFGMGFGKNAVRNVIVGMLVWNLVSGLTRRPYYVYNYYNNPEKVPEDIPVPANSIVLCSENVTSLCAPDTAALCTSDNKILCVVLAQQTVPCQDNSSMKCAASKAQECEENDKDCNTKKTEAEKDKTAFTVNIPCVTNATIVGKMLDDKTITFTGTGTVLKTDANSESTTLCVTTFALPQPEEEAKTNDATLPPCEPETTTNSNGTAVPCIPISSTTQTTLSSASSSSTTENTTQA